jgi:hypothetical protein
MALTLLRTPSLTVNAVDLASCASAIDFQVGAEAKEVTVFGDTTRKNLAGLLNWTLKIKFRQDRANSKVLLTLYPLIGAVPFNVIFKFDSGGTSPNNPQYTCSCILTKLPVVSGAVGDFEEFDIDFTPAGAVSVATS